MQNIRTSAAYAETMLQLREYPFIHVGFLANHAKNPLIKFAAQDTMEMYANGELKKRIEDCELVEE